jgi:hypothetical protein
MSLDNPQPLGPLFPTAVYKDPQAILTALQSYARANSFAVIRDTIKPNTQEPTYIVYICTKGGSYRPKSKDPTVHTSRKRESGTKKTGCKYRVVASRDKVLGTWTVTTKENSHNHGTAQATTVDSVYRLAALDPEGREFIIKCAANNQSTPSILSTLHARYPGLELLPSDIYNVLYTERIEKLGSLTSIEWLVKVINLITTYSFLFTYYLPRSLKTKAFTQLTPPRTNT